MATRSIRIGSLEDIHQYDDGDFDSALETTAPIKVGTPVDPTDVVRLQDLADGALLDGDHIDIDYIPTNYTPDDTPAVADDVDDLAAHFAGIDNELGTINTTITNLLSTIAIHNSNVICHNGEVVTI